MTTKADLGPNTAERIGAYRVVRRLATGGTSDVLLAKAEGPHGFERTVVLKVLLSHFGKDDEVSRMFAREASAYARLSHPCIVRLFDFFAVPADAKKGGQLVMVLEYVDGPPLARLKSMVKAIGKEIDDRAAIYVATSIFDGLAAAHSAVDDHGIPAPVVHRDVNPSNVLVPWDGYAKLADFGVAKVTGLGHHSVVGMIKGTYGYMAPEQVTGNEAVTPRSDVYAAAIILWELLTRRRAFQRGALPEIEALRAMAEPRLPALESIRSDIDRTVRDALRRALEPRAEKRKITAEEMVSILSAIVPPEQGRERLVSILGLVRNDARAANAHASMAPPPMPPEAPRSEPLLPDAVIPGSPKVADFGPVTMSGVAPPVTQQGVAPTNLGAPSRLMPKTAPRPSSARMPVASPADIPPPPAHIGNAPVELTTRELLSLPTRPAMAAVVPPTPTAGAAPLAAPPQPQRIASRPALPAATLGGPRAASEAPPRHASAASRLAVSIPDDPKLPVGREATEARTLSLLDTLGEAPDERMSIPPDSPRVAAPLKDLTGGLGLRDAIDEIMRGVPGSQANIAAAAAAAAEKQAEGPTASDRPAMRETRRVPADMTSTLIGMIPPSPPPMTPSLFPQLEGDPPTASTQDTAPPRPPTASKDDFPNAGDDEPLETVVQPEPLPPITPRTTPVAKPMAQTLAMEARPPIPSNQATATGAMPRYTPAPFPQAQPHTPSQEPPPVISRPPMAQLVGADLRPSSSPGPVGTTYPPRRGVGFGAVAVALVVVIALGIAGTVAFVRYQATKDVNVGAGSVPPYPTLSTVVAVEPPASATAPVSAVLPAAVDASVPAAALDAGAPTLTVVDAGAPTSAIVDAGAPAIAEGMGLVKTANAAPGRRIFVDDKVIGQTPETVSVKCGEHAIKLGSTGTVQKLNVPCDGEIVVGDVKP